MHRVIVPLLLTILLTLPTAIPVSAADPPAAPSAGPAATGSTIDATDRYIVMTRNGADTTAVVDKAGKRDGVKADRKFSKAVHGFSAKLDAQQKRDLMADPNVIAVVPDEVIHLTGQTVPTGVSRIGDRLNPIAKIDGTDQRVDADVAIVDTGIAYHPDLNVAGGYNCSTSDHTAWRDVEHHGTHVAGIVGALDNGSGVVGVAPGARVWGVKILNDSGDGLISWYVCGLDWILAQRDPKDPSRPLFEAVNMSVTKPGSDDHNCGFTNHDPLHQAICRVVAGGITVVAAAANDHHDASKNIPASYDEVITVSALADTDGKSGGLGGNACYSWGTYDKDDTFADFSNYGSDVDLIAPGKCILSTIPGGYGTMSGTSMAAPTVTGAVALYKSSRPNATPAEVRDALRYLGNQGWKTSTDPDGTHEPLLDVSRLGPLGTFSLVAPAVAPTVEGGQAVLVPVTIVRSDTFFDRVTFSIAALPEGWTATAPSAMGWTADTTSLRVTPPLGTPPGTYEIGVEGASQGRIVPATVMVDVVEDDPTAQPPVATLRLGSRMALGAAWVDVTWPAATDPSSPITAYQVQRSVAGGPWSGLITRTAAQRSGGYLVAFGAATRFRVRAADSAGHWSPWAQSVVSTTLRPIDDRSTSVTRSRGWSRSWTSTSYRHTVTSSSVRGARLSMTFTGRQVAVVGPRGPDRGAAKVYIDGSYVGTMTFWSSGAERLQLRFVKAFPTVGSHRITLQVIGTGTHPLFRVDAFVVSR
jgi:subtilisin family serine protease